MKTPFLYRFVLFSLVMALPLLASAKRTISYPHWEAEGMLLTDSTIRRQPQKPEEDRRPDNDERIKPDIKEVPRSRRLPKPTVVTDRVRIKRPPVRLLRPGRGVGRQIGVHRLVN